MHTAPSTRRVFLADLTRAAAAAGLSLQLPLLTTLAGCARDAGEFKRLTPVEARTMRAFAAQIIPSEKSSPGAEEAGAVFFVDQAFGEKFFADTVPVIQNGLADLDARARGTGAHDGFASLSSKDQIAIMRLIEHEPFFDAARTLVLVGTFSDPVHGGNRGGTSLALTGMTNSHRYSAPFGWYDGHASADRKRSLA
jgi:hypothetical protein